MVIAGAGKPPQAEAATSEEVRDFTGVAPMDEVRCAPNHGMVLDA